MAPHELSTCVAKQKCVLDCARREKVCPLVAQLAATSACDAVEKLKKGSLLFECSQSMDFTPLNIQDIAIGKRLGRGGFSKVEECKIMTLDSDGTQEFALKSLRQETMLDRTKFVNGATDLAIEAHFLQILNHPNIIKLHGVSAGDMDMNLASGKEYGFFIVVDRLIDTLGQRIKRECIQKSQSSGTSMGAESREQKQMKLKQDISIGLSIARAMEYLHSRNIVLRDLKPANLGFDQDGVLKLFDFGMARELKEMTKTENGRFEINHCAGTWKYMAPECIKGLPFNEKVDVYSFGILLWELCSSRRAFEGYKSRECMRCVVLEGERPKLDSEDKLYWPLSLVRLIENCWSPIINQRPSFTQIKETLLGILNSQESKTLHSLPPKAKTKAYSKTAKSKFAEQPKIRLRDLNLRPRILLGAYVSACLMKLQVALKNRRRRRLMKKRDEKAQRQQEENCQMYHEWLAGNVKSSADQSSRSSGTLSSASTDSAEQPEQPYQGLARTHVVLFLEGSDAVV